MTRERGRVGNGQGHGKSQKCTMKCVWTRHWPFMAAVGILCAVVAGVFALCVRMDGGRFVYAIDDIYIAMSVARNFAAHGVWGVTPYEFTSCESTILWPLLLASSYALGVTSELVPLLLNVIFAGGVLLVVYVLLKKCGLPQSYQAAALLVVIFLTPLPAMIFIGMEHTLQIGCSLLFVYIVARELAGQGGGRAGASPWIWVLAVVMSLIRYEGLFLVFAASVLFFARKRWVEAFGIGLLAAAPPVIYGAISVRHGWYWLPNSVYLKANLPHAIGRWRILGLMGNRDGWSMSADVWMMGLALLILLPLLVYRQKTLWQETTIMIVLVTITAGLHLRFARFGWFFRYEAYLVALSLVVLVVGGFEYLSGRRGHTSNKAETVLAGGWLGWSLLSVVLVLGVRGYTSLCLIPRVSHNIYEQQYQMGLFLRQFYRGAPIAATDIGAVSYLGEPHLEDLWGLGSLDSARQRVQGPLTPQQIETLTRPKGTQIAILFDAIFTDGPVGTGGLPPQWIQVGRWKLNDNLICTQDTVSFYAVESSEEKPLIAHLRDFAPRLPRGIEQTGKYMQSD